MTVVLDTNVLIAAFIANGVCHDLLETCLRNHVIVSCEFILEELQEKLANRFHLSQDIVDQAVELIRSHAMIVNPAALEAPVCRDQDDDIVLGAAAAGNAETIVTGDKDLLVLGRHEDIEILSPSQFVARESGLSV